MTMDLSQNSSIVLETKNLDVQVPGRTLIKQLNWQLKNVSE